MRWHDAGCLHRVRGLCGRRQNSHLHAAACRRPRQSTGMDTHPRNTLPAGPKGRPSPLAISASTRARESFTTSPASLSSTSARRSPPTRRHRPFLIVPSTTVGFSACSSAASCQKTVEALIAPPCAGPLWAPGRTGRGGGGRAGLGGRGLLEGGGGGAGARGSWESVLQRRRPAIREARSGCPGSRGVRER
jgi:hypothetical protein